VAICVKAFVHKTRNARRPHTREMLIISSDMSFDRGHVPIVLSSEQKRVSIIYTLQKRRNRSIETEMNMPIVFCQCQLKLQRFGQLRQIVQ
jgi:hypothetical protein